MTRSPCIFRNTLLTLPLVILAACPDGPAWVTTDEETTSTGAAPTTSAGSTADATTTTAATDATSDTTAAATCKQLSGGEEACNLIREDCLCRAAAHGLPVEN